VQRIAANVQEVRDAGSEHPVRCNKHAVLREEVRSEAARDHRLQRMPRAAA
jgi:hypothetical protein